MFPVSTQHAVSACIQTVSRLFAFIPIINIFLSCKSQIIQQSKRPSPQVDWALCKSVTFFPLLVKWLKTPLNYLFAALILIYTFFMKRSQITFMSFYWPQVLCCNAFKLIIKWFFFFLVQMCRMVSPHVKSDSMMWTKLYPKKIQTLTSWCISLLASRINRSKYNQGKFNLINWCIHPKRSWFLSHTLHINR